MEGRAVPFTVTRQGSDIYVSIETKGMMRLDGEALVIEFVDISTDYSKGGMTSEKAPLQVARIDLADIDSASYGRRVLRASMIELRCRSMTALAELPFADGNRVTVRVARADRERARDLATTLELALADRRLRALGDGAP